MGNYLFLISGSLKDLGLFKFSVYSGVNFGTLYSSRNSPILSRFYEYIGVWSYIIFLYFPLFILCLLYLLLLCFVISLAKSLLALLYLQRLVITP